MDEMIAYIPLISALVSFVIGTTFLLIMIQVDGAENAVTSPISKSYMKTEARYCTIAYILTTGLSYIISYEKNRIIFDNKNIWFKVFFGIFIFLLLVFSVLLTLKIKKLYKVSKYEKSNFKKWVYKILANVSMVVGSIVGGIITNDLVLILFKQSKSTLRIDYLITLWFITYFLSIVTFTTIYLYGNTFDLKKYTFYGKEIRIINASGDVKKWQQFRCYLIGENDRYYIVKPEYEQNALFVSKENIDVYFCNE